MDYIEKPLYPTRTALLAARRKAMLPPMSYDFNGDGVVLSTHSTTHAPTHARTRAL